MRANKIAAVILATIVLSSCSSQNIYVEKSYRNKNIASKLMDKLIEFAIDNKCINITLEVDESNDAAINLYKKYGFIIATIRKKYYGKNDGYLMIREMV